MQCMDLIEIKKKNYDNITYNCSIFLQHYLLTKYYDYLKTC